jgi:amidase
MFEVGAPADISVIGPLARSARDLGLALDAIMGPDPDETAQKFVLPPVRTTRASELRVAVWAHEPGQATSDATVAAVEEAGRRLESLGARVDFSARPDVDTTEAFHLYVKLLDAALSARLPDHALERRRAGKAALAADDLSVNAITLRATDMTHREWLTLNSQRTRMKLAWAALFRDFDVLLCPAFGVPAFAHLQEGEMWQRRIAVDGRIIGYNDLLFWPGITCAFHLPATVVPVGKSADGLPIGVQVAGPPFGDLTTIAVAEMLEAEGFGFVAPGGWESGARRRN